MEPAILIPAAVLMSFLLTGLATWYAARRGLIDHPGERHSHTVATPHGGGAGLVLALLIFSLLIFGEDDGFWMRCALPGIVVLSVLGWWDDHASLSARFRFLIQLAVSLYLIGYGLHSGWPGGVLQFAGAALFLLWMTNLYNFMDGSNGMAGFQGVFGAALLAWLFEHAGDHQIAVAAALLAACCLGFLPWNLGRARVFMGDTGSLALGFALGGLLIYGVATGAFGLPVALMVMLVFLTDSTLTLLLRVLKGERWYTAHRQHLYQRLIVHGWTHARVLLLYQAINLTLVLPAIVVADNYPALAWIVALAMILALGLGWYLVLRNIGVFARAG
jgi:UDP-N-acetylmuramyl pentapeptide phosphotransferase/UDP-N-acetylglucosamine-1-phosphate transferase